MNNQELSLDDDSLTTLVYLWTRDAKMPVGKETEEYVKQQLDHLWTPKQFSDLKRIEMSRRIVMKEAKKEGHNYVHLRKGEYPHEMVYDKFCKKCVEDEQSRRTDSG